MKSNVAVIGLSGPEKDVPPRVSARLAAAVAATPASPGSTGTIDGRHRLMS
jgi:hypothetical protein